MEFFIENAWAEAAAPPSGGFMSLVPLILLFLVFYFLLIRPQTKRAKEHKKMIETLAKGDEIVTNGGLLGKITELGDNFVVIEIALNTEVKLQRHAIAAIMPKGTIKTL
jgi:preprotein translocase subunit YajC